MQNDSKRINLTASYLCAIGKSMELILCAAVSSFQQNNGRIQKTIDLSHLLFSVFFLWKLLFSLWVIWIRNDLKRVTCIELRINQYLCIVSLSILCVLWVFVVLTLEKKKCFCIKTLVHWLGRKTENTLNGGAGGDEANATFEWTNRLCLNSYLNRANSYSVQIESRQKGRTGGGCGNQGATARGPPRFCVIVRDVGLTQ